MTTVQQPDTPAAPQAAEAGRYDAFLSYARDNRDFVVDYLCATLRVRGHDVWVDVDITGGAQWRERIKRGIEACKALIFVVSPASIASEACAQELEDAVALNKRIIPVVYEDVAPGLMPSALADVEWVLLRAADAQALGMAHLVEALETDIEWRDQHTRLAGRAREWLDSERNSSYLLRGADLRAAEAWLAQQEGHREAPTREQGEYIARSRQAAGRRLYTVIGALVVGLMITLALALIALIQRHHAVSEAHVAQSQLLAGQSGSAGNLQQASVLAIEAYRLSPTLDARNAILNVANSHELGAPLRAQGSISNVAFSPDRKLVAFADGTVRLWDVTTHREIGPALTGNAGAITSVAFSPNGRILASGGDKDSIRLWDVATHREIGPPLTGPVHGVTSIVFSPNGLVLAFISSEGRTVESWDLGLRRRLTPALSVNEGNPGGVPGFAPPQAFGTLAFSPDGTTIATTDNDGIRLWNVATHRQIGSPFVLATVDPNIRGPTSVAFSPDGKTLASAHGDNTVRLWDVATHHLLGPALTAPANSVAFSPDGRLLVSGGADNTVRLWNVATHRELGPALTGHTASVNTVAFSPDESMVASGSVDRTVRLWSVAGPRQLGSPLAGHEAGSLAVSPDGKLLAAGGASSEARVEPLIRLWDVRTHREVGPPLIGHTDGVITLAFSPNSRLLASAAPGADGTIRFWDLASHRQVGRPLTDSSVDSVAFSPDGKTLASADDGGIRLWSVVTHRQLVSLRGSDPNGAEGLAFSRDGKVLASGSGNSIRLWDVGSRRQIGPPLTGHADPVDTLAFSPDGKLVVSGSNDNTVGLWDVATHRALGAPITGHTAPILSVAFSVDGKTVASGGLDNSIRLWDVASHRQLGPTVTGKLLAFSPDGKTLMSSAIDGSIRFWTTYPPDIYIQQLCTYINPGQARRFWRQAEPSISYQPPC